MELKIYINLATHNKKKDSKIILRLKKFHGIPRICVPRGVGWKYSSPQVKIHFLFQQSQTNLVITFRICIPLCEITFLQEVNKKMVHEITFLKFDC